MSLPRLAAFAMPLSPRLVRRRPSRLPSRRLALAATALLLACAAPGPAQARPPGARDWDIEVMVDGAPAPRFAHAGERYVLGQAGDRYTLRVRNFTGRRVVAVVSIDGRDVLDGKTADVRGRGGYVIPAYGHADVDGWRLSQHEAAAFRFSSVSDSYAARTGSARNVGVIGVAIFPERWVPPARPNAIESHRRSRAEEAQGVGARDHEAAADATADGTAAKAKSWGPPAAAAPAAPAESASESTRGPAPQRRHGPSARPGLGTEFGEALASSVTTVPFVREDAHRPAAVLMIRYNDRPGLIALGIDVDGPAFVTADELARRQAANPFPATDRRWASPPPGWRR